MKIKILISFFIIILNSYYTKSQNECMDIFISCKEGLSSTTNINSGEPLSHFPKILCEKKNQLILTIPLFGDNSAGLMYSEQLSIKQIDSIKENFLYKDSILYYSPDVFRIRQFVINDTLTHFDTSVLARYPVPTFYLGLNKNGEIYEDWLYEVDSIVVPDKQPIYIAPKDLIIYIIDAKSGYFWNDPHHYLLRPFLGKWTHGYSRGIAVSKKEKIICYWFMIW
jgi:hypothetical protein